MVKASKTKYTLLYAAESDRVRTGSSVTKDGDTFDVINEILVDN